MAIEQTRKFKLTYGLGRRPQRWRTTLEGVIALLTVSAVGAFIYATMQNGLTYSTPINNMMIVQLGAFIVVFLVAIATAYTKPLKNVKAEEHFVWVEGIGADFLSQLPDFNESKKW